MTQLKLKKEIIQEEEKKEKGTETYVVGLAQRFYGLRFDLVGLNLFNVNYVYHLIKVIFSGRN